MRLFDVSDAATRTVRHVLEFQARQNGDTVWLRTEDRSVTFGEAHAAVMRYASGLGRLGVQQGDVVALFARASIDAILPAQAAAALGAIFTVLNTDYSGAFLRDQLDTSKARLVLVDPDLLDRFVAATPAGHHQVLVIGEEVPTHRGTNQLVEFGDAPPLPPMTYLDPVQVCWSSATTGKSKGIIHSHSGLLLLAYDWVSYRIQPGDVSYVCTPFCLSGAWNCGIWSGLVSGTTVALDQSFSVGRFWDRVRFYGANHIFTLGAMHMYLWKQPPLPDDKESGVRCAVCIPMSWSQIAKFKERFGIQQMPQMYGNTETFALMMAADDGTDWPDNAMGIALPQYQIKLFAENDQEVPVGEVGEICVRPTEPGRLFLGYLGAPDETVATWRNLWHHQGDMASRDEDGVYYFADRKQDYIRYAGRNISLAEVEKVVAQHPDIADLAAFGITSDELESEAELALVVVAHPSSSLSASELATFINDNAPYYFVPRYMEFIDEIPRNSHFKVLREELRKRGMSESCWDRRSSGFVARR